MNKNIIIQFEPTITYKTYIFSNNPSRETEYFCHKLLIDNLNNILNKIPKKILDKYNSDGWKIIITNTRNLEKEFGYNFKIHGCTLYEEKQTIVYANKYGIEAIPHEIAHYLDSLINISQTIEWKEIYEKEKDFYKGTYLIDFFTKIDSKEECFADAFLAYIMNKDSLKKHAKETYNVINNIIEYIDYLI